MKVNAAGFERNTNCQRAFILSGSLEYFESAKTIATTDDVA